MVLVEVTFVVFWCAFLLHYAVGVCILFLPAFIEPWDPTDSLFFSRPCSLT